MNGVYELKMYLILKYLIKTFYNFVTKNRGYSYLVDQSWMEMGSFVLALKKKCQKADTKIKRMLSMN